MIEMMQGVASCLSMRGACDEAASLMRECLDLARTDFGLEHPLTMNSMDLLADVLLECGSFKEAEELLTQCLDSSNRLLGAEHPHVSCCCFLPAHVSLCDPCADIVFSIEVGGVLV